jgi:ABC-type multidrug transport system fused ATPase/permease subunit
MTYLHYLILSLVAISGVFLIGKIIFNVLKLSMPYPYQTFFLKSFLGTCLLSFVTAIFSTRFQSILILFLLIALFILLFSLTIKTLPLNHQITNKKTSYRWVTIEALLLCSFVFTIRFFHLYQQDGIFAIPHPDYVYYTRLSSYLLNFGIENSQIEPVFVESHGTKPYHYFELWLNGAFIFASGLNGLIVLMTVTYSLLTVLVWAGIMACVEEIKKRISWSDKLLGAVLLFICGLYLPFYSNSSFLSSSATFSFSLWTQPKISVIYLFILPGILFLLKGNKRMAVCCFLLLPVVYITTAPGVLAGLVLWIVIDYFFYNRDANSMGQALTGIILTALAIIGFYLITE